MSLEIDRSLNSLSLMSPRVSDHIRSQVSLAAVWHLLGDCNVSRGAQGRFGVDRKLEINTGSLCFSLFESARRFQCAGQQPRCTHICWDYITQCLLIDQESMDSKSAEATELGSYNTNGLGY